VLDAAPGGAPQSVIVAVSAGKPLKARTGDPVRFIRGDYAGQRGTVVSESDDGDLGKQWSEKRMQHQ